jgi:hypothetical protein
VDATSILVRHTLLGDANLDRAVKVADLGILALNWQQSPRVFSQGDFNYDGNVNVDDLGFLATNWQRLLGAPAVSAVQTSPRSSKRGDIIQLIGLA